MTNSSALEWMDRMNCHDEPDFGDWTVAEQKKVCIGCPVQPECLEFGLSGLQFNPGRPSEGVVFGGLGPADLAKLHRLRTEVAT